jgi:hypothetical protein
MFLTWTNLKISFAGARLSHLVQKDKIWDHGSMIEQVRTLYHQMQKAVSQSDPTLVSRYMSVNCFYQLLKRKAEFQSFGATTSKLIKVDIIRVMPGNNINPHRFCALLQQNSNSNLNSVSKWETLENGKVKLYKWLFVNNGNWWLLDQFSD